MIWFSWSVGMNLCIAMTLHTLLEKLTYSRWCCSVFLVQCWWAFFFSWDLFISCFVFCFFAETPECFICKDVQLVDGEQLKRFCDCKNLMAHHSCLLTWVRTVCIVYCTTNFFFYFAHLCWPNELYVQPSTHLVLVQYLAMHFLCTVWSNQHVQEVKDSK